MSKCLQMPDGKGRAGARATLADSQGQGSSQNPPKAALQCAHRSKARQTDRVLLVSSICAVMLRHAAVGAAAFLCGGGAASALCAEDSRGPRVLGEFAAGAGLMFRDSGAPKRASALSPWCCQNCQQSVKSVPVNAVALSEEHAAFCHGSD